ncbi:MAG: carbon storage regulator CsrA [Isosphaeraceae bacterium]|nr:carbon storage regulator CsrA [Isosphaeraceae bacterium]
MLILSRKLGERIQIGQDIRITIVKIDRNSVRIGIDAPDGVRICREEIAFERETAGLAASGRTAASTL